MKHEHYDLVKEYIELGLFPLLEGPAGSGKTTTAKAIAADLKRKFYSMSMTKQTSLGHFMGFISVNGDYIGTLFREAFENGGLMLIDEIDAGDPNTLLALNTIENGFMSFPDKLVERHKDFILVATANPADEGNIYTGRSKLDFATRDRFIPVEMNLDHDLEENITDPESAAIANVTRTLLVEYGVTRSISMRDTIRYHIIKQSKIVKNPLNVFVRGNVEIVEKLEAKVQVIKSQSISLSTAESFDDLYDLIKMKQS